MNRRLPRPVFENIECVLCSIESGAVDEEGFPLALKDLDRNLADAAGRDMRTLMSAILSCFADSKTAAAHGYRTRQILTCFGWVPVHYAYVRHASTSALLNALGVATRCTTTARDWAVHCAALCGSFTEGAAMLRQLTSMDLSVSKLRKIALAYGEQCLLTQNRAARDVRSYPERVPKDGEAALENALRDAFPNALFTNDFMHACAYVHTRCENLGLSGPEIGKEYRFLRGLLYRCGATAVIKRLETKYAQAMDSSAEAEKALDYIRKRKENMHYGKLRREGLFIASGHVEAAARVLVVRRCKQAGMHWRHQNVIRISAILAHLRSAA